MAVSRSSLPPVPFVDVDADGPLRLLQQERARAEALLAISRRSYTAPALRIGDAVSKRWLTRSANPYRRDILAIGSALGVPGAALLNMSFEWTCTTGAAPSPDGSGNRMLRVLDWRLPGLGAHVVVARERAPAGLFYNVTWPGAVAVLTAMAPGRFSAALNQAPMRQHGLGLLGNWAVCRAKVWRSTALPPAHLLRKVFETATDFAQAKRMLTETPLCLPALFTLSGVRAEEGCVIERTVASDRSRARPRQPGAPRADGAHPDAETVRLRLDGGAHPQPLHPACRHGERRPGHAGRAGL
jgi:hypothetical protein